MFLSKSSLLAVVLSAFALGSVACYDPSTAAPANGVNDQEAQPEPEADQTGDPNEDGTVAPADIAAPPPAPVPLTCVLPSPHGTVNGVNESQCKQLLSIAGCSKSGAVVNDTMKCSTTSSALPETRPTDFSNGEPRPVPLTCKLPSPHGSIPNVNEDQCKQLLSIAGCEKPGAVVGDTMKCSTTTQEAPQSPSDVGAAPSGPVPVTCVLPSPYGSASDVTEDQCKKLLSIAGCPRPGAVLNDTMKCSTATRVDPAGGYVGPGGITSVPTGPIPLTCRLPSPLGSVSDVTADQCKKLLSIAGCPKPGAVVGDTMQCSTT